MKVALFGGSFDPVHREHVRYIEAAKEALSLDKVILIPSNLAPHKEGGAHASGEDRLNMCRLAIKDLDYAEASDFELKREGKSYTYLTAERFAEEYRGEKLFFLVGADMLEDFFTWKYPERILSAVTLVACGRGRGSASLTHEKFKERFFTDYIEVPFTGGETSSTELRVRLAFGKETQELMPEVRAYIDKRGLYRYPAIAPALALEKEERQRHSFRVALMAVERARSLGICEEKAMLAAALHDCGKYVPLDSPLLEGFELPEGVPATVVHQYTGAYLAEHRFGIEDQEILDAIRFHTSGREDMTPLGKLIFLADMLESGRDYEGVDSMRKTFWRDLDECLKAALTRQIVYLKETGRPIYNKTQEALDYLIK